MECLSLFNGKIRKISSRKNTYNLSSAELAQKVTNINQNTNSAGGSSVSECSLRIWS